MERWPLILSTLFFLVSFGWTMFALGAGKYRPSRLNLVVISAGFAAQTWFLYLRGEMLGRCPLTNLFEVLIFLSWSMVLFYLVIGPAYRLTLLGAFTAPFATIFQMVALIAPLDAAPVAGAPRPNPWLELHAAVSVMAYGAFALACVAGLMFLVQERQLKSHRFNAVFYHLPPITELATAIKSLLFAGMALLSVGLGAGFVVGSPGKKILWGIGVWVLYGLILLMRQKLSARRVALMAVTAFTVTLASLWGINQLPGGPN